MERTPQVLGASCYKLLQGFVNGIHHTKCMHEHAWFGDVNYVATEC